MILWHYLNSFTCFIGVHDWGRWKSGKSGGGIALSEIRECKWCNKVQKRTRRK